MNFEEVVDNVKQNPAPYLIGAGVIGIVAFVASKAPKPGSTSGNSGGGLSFSGGTPQGNGSYGGNGGGYTNPLQDYQTKLALDLAQAKGINDIEQGNKTSDLTRYKDKNGFDFDITRSLTIFGEDNRQRQTTFNNASNKDVVTFNEGVRQTQSAFNQNLAKDGARFNEGLRQEGATFDTGNAFAQGRNNNALTDELGRVTNALTFQAGKNQNSLTKQAGENAIALNDKAFASNLSQRTKEFDFLFAPFASKGRTPAPNTPNSSTPANLDALVKSAGDSAYNAVFQTPARNTSFGGIDQQMQAKKARKNAEDSIRNSFASGGGANNPQPSTVFGNRFDTYYEAQQRGTREDRTFQFQAADKEYEYQKGLINEARKPQGSQCKKVFGLFGCGTQGAVEGLSDIASNAASYFTGGAVSWANNGNGGGGNNGGFNFDFASIFGRPKQGQTNRPLPNGTTVSTPPFNPNPVFQNA